MHSICTCKIHIYNKKSKNTVGKCPNSNVEIAGSGTFATPKAIRHKYMTAHSHDLEQALQ